MSDRRSGVLLALVLLAQLVLLSAQVPDRQLQGNLLEATGLRVTAPLAHLVSGSVKLAENLGRVLSDRRSLRRDNASLQAEVEQLRLELAQRRDMEAQFQQLLEAMDYQSPEAVEIAVANVVYIDHLSWLRTLVVHVPARGSTDLLERGSPVTTHEGLVGRVVAVEGRYARVQLITDRSSSVGAMIARTRRQGIARGVGSGELALDYVPLQADVRVGDRLVTAGIDGVYPRGVPIGSVISVAPSDELFHRVRVAPAVDFGLLDQVYLLPRSALPEGLAQRVDGAGG